MSAHSQRASAANDPRRHWLVRHWFVHGILAAMRANPEVDFGSIRGVCCAEEDTGGKAQEEDPILGGHHEKASSRAFPSQKDRM
jgi:hypothetical protein